MNKINLGTPGRETQFLSVNLQLFANIMISATDSYLSDITGIERTHNLKLLLVLGILAPVKIGGPCTRSVICTFSFDSDVVPQRQQIQDLLKPSNIN